MSAPALPRAFPEVVLHVGLQKTGTTTIQWVLRKIRPELRRRGVVYLDRGQITRLPHYPRSAALPVGTPEGSRAFQVELAALAAAEWEKTRERSGADPVLVLASNEALLGVHTWRSMHERPLRPRAEATLGEALGVLPADRVRLLLYVRRQDRLLESFYMHRIHGGGSEPFDEYAETVLARPYLFFAGLVERLEAIVDVTSVTVRPFELIGAGGDAFLTDFLAAAGVPDLDSLAIPEVPRVNPSHSAKGLAIARDGNARLRGKGEKRGLRDLLVQLFPPGEYPRAQLFTDDQRARVVDAHRADNERLFERWMPDLPAASYASDEATDRLARVLVPRRPAAP